MTDAFEEFAQYYRDEALYGADDRRRVLIALRDGAVLGALIVSVGVECASVGSVGCTAVRTACRNRGIASNLVILGTAHLKAAGMERAFLGYTYSGLDKLYGRAGYKICCYYFMAGKALRN